MTLYQNKGDLNITLKKNSVYDKIPGHGKGRTEVLLCPRQSYRNAIKILALVIACKFWRKRNCKHLRVFLSTRLWESWGFKWKVSGRGRDERKKKRKCYCKYAEEHQTDVRGPFYGFAKWTRRFHKHPCILYCWQIIQPLCHLKNCWIFPTSREKYSPQYFFKMSEKVGLDTGWGLCRKSRVMFQKADRKRCVPPNGIEFHGENSDWVCFGTVSSQGMFA